MDQLKKDWIIGSIPTLVNHNVKNDFEKDWITKSGLRAVVVINKSLGHRCGYVGVHKSNGLFSVNYESIVPLVDVHGGLTFSGRMSDSQMNLWWFGYDCGHHSDHSIFNPSGIKRSLAYCVKECEFLASQIVDTPLEYLWKFKRNGSLSEEYHNKMIAWSISNPDSITKEYFESLMIKNA